MDLQSSSQVSFIPKKPLTSSPLSSGGVSSILWIIAVFIFAVSVMAALGAFSYVWYLDNRIASAKNSLDLARAAYDPTAIEDLIHLNSRIEQAKLLLTKHVAPSAIFTFLEKNTLASVRFSGFEYGNNLDGSVGIKLAGNAVDFASVALQSDQFGAVTRVLKNVIFSDVNIDATTGIVGFNVSATFNPDLMLYREQLATGGAVDSTSSPPENIVVPPTSFSTTTSTGASTSTPHQ